MDSSVMSGTSSNSTTRSASICIVHRCRPSGGFVQASATTNARSFGPNFGRAPGRGRSRRDASSPSSTNRRRIRSTVATPMRSAFTISSSVRPSEANNSVWARRTIRTDAVPFRVRLSRRSRSVSVRVTRYRFATILPSTKKQHHGFCLPIASSLAKYYVDVAGVPALAFAQRIKTTVAGPREPNEVVLLSLDGAVQRREATGSTQLVFFLRELGLSAALYDGTLQQIRGAGSGRPAYVVAENSRAAAAARRLLEADGRMVVVKEVKPPR